MKRRLLLMLFILIISLNTGCQSMQNQENEDINLKESAQDEVSNDKDSGSIRYEVPRDGGAFSKNDLIYFIMIDRFNDGDPSNNNLSDVNKNDPKSFQGGDIRGIIEKLDYIKSLGATAIWITPVKKNEPYGYHGYWINDFYSVDPHFGTMEDLKELVREAHSRDLKIMLDHVVNHTGYKSPWLNDPKYKDWFNPRLEISNWNDQTQIERGWLAGLPDLNQDNPEVREFLLNNVMWWIEETGIDGMRLDTVKHVPKDFWNEFAYTIKSKYPDFFLLGEVWNDNPLYLEGYHKLGIDGLTNFPLYTGISKTFTRFGKTSPLIYAIEQQKHFSNPHLNGVFIDNHDVRRLITQAGPDGEEYLKQALTFMMTYPAIPILYYGTEIGMEGGDDPDNRRFMQWDRIDSSEIFSFYKSLVELRENHPAIIDGDFKLLDYDSYFLSYIREKGNDSVVVIINLQNREKEVAINIPNSSKIYKELLTEKEYVVDNNTMEVNLEPLGLVILKSN